MKQLAWRIFMKNKRLSKPILLVLMALAGNLLIGLAAAHDPRPLKIDITQTTPNGQILVKWKTPAALPYQSRPIVQLEAPCKAQSDILESRHTNAYFARQDYLCASEGNTQIILQIKYPYGNPSLASFIKYQDLNAPTTQPITEMLAPGIVTWEVPHAVSAAKNRAAPIYLSLGFWHILEGWDHLLFLLCLIVLSGTPKRLFWGITGFTLSHSISLAAASLALVSLPILLVEALIALSIVFLAAEVLRQNKQTLAWRYPVITAFFFGLLHGFGFANVLYHLGLPEENIISALLFFNLGVELGQIFFVLSLLALTYFSRQIAHQFTAPAQQLRLSRYAQKSILISAGILAGYWSVERLMALFA